MAKIIEEDELPNRDRGLGKYPWAEWVKMAGEASLGTLLELEKKDFPEDSYVYRHWDDPTKRSAIAQQAKAHGLILIQRGPKLYLKWKDQP